MNTNLLTNKIIGVVIALVVTLTIVVPICSELGGSSGPGHANSPPSDIYGFTMSGAPYMQDTGMGLPVGSGNYSIIFAPTEDTLNYIEGDLILVASHYDSETLEVTYSKGKFNVISEAEDDITGTYNVMMVSNSSYDDVFIGFYDTVEDAKNYNNLATYYGSIVLVKIYNMDNADKDFWSEDERTIAKNSLVYLTDNPHITISISDYYERVNQLIDLIGEAGAFTTAGLVGGYTGDGQALTTVLRPTLLMPIYLTGLDDIEGAIPTEMQEIISESESLQSYSTRPISLKSWTDIDIPIADDTSIRFDNKYLAFNTELPYTMEGGNGGDNGTVGTLVQLIPIFIVLAIIGSVAKLMYSKKESLI